MIEDLILRAATVTDRDAILALRRRCFASEDTEKLDPRFWEWQFLRAPAGQGLSFVAEAAGRVIAHVALIPQEYVVDGRFASAAMAADAMTDPDARGYGIYTRLHAFALRNAPSCRFGIAYQIRRQALSPLLRNGWSPRFKLPVLVRPVSLGKLFAATRKESLNEIEASAEDLGGVASEFFGGRGVHQHRTPRYFSWRYFDSPLWKYDVRASRVGRDVVAYVITRRTMLKGFSTLAILDIAWRNGREREAGRMVRDVIRRADTQLAAALMSTAHLSFSLLLRNWFLPGPHRFQFLLRELDSQAVLPVTNSRWSLTWGDTDHL